MKDGREGDIRELHIGLKGTMSALYIKDLALKTHGGREGRVREGKAATSVQFQLTVSVSVANATGASAADPTMI